MTVFVCVRVLALLLLFCGAASVRVQEVESFDIARSAAQEHVSEKEAESSLSIDHLDFQKVLTFTASNIRDESYFEIGSQHDSKDEAEEGQTYIREMRLDFLATSSVAFAPCYDSCYDGQLKACQRKCWFFQWWCKPACKKTVKAECMRNCAGPQIIVSRRDAARWDRTFSYPATLRNRSAPTFFKLALRLPGEKNARVEGSDKPLRGVWSLTINGMEVPWIEKDNELAHYNLGLEMNLLKFGGMEVQTTRVDDMSCSVSCSAEECTLDHANSCYGHGQLTGSEHCSTYQNVVDESRILRQCSVSKKPIAQTSSCCRGYPQPLFWRHFDHALVRRGRTWARVLPGDVGGQIAYDVCQADQGTPDTRPSPELCRNMAGRTVQVMDVMSVGNIYHRWQVWDPTQTPDRRVLQLPPGMLTEEFTPVEKLLEMPAGDWGMRVRDDGWIEFIGQGSPSAMQGAEANRFFINRISDGSAHWAWGPARYREFHGRRAKLLISEVKDPLRACSDQSTFRDKDNLRCSHYSERKYCLRDDATAWVNTKKWWGYNRWFFWQRNYHIHERADYSGISAMEACCVCGGGMTTQALDSPSTTTMIPEPVTIPPSTAEPSTTPAPTPSPTPAPLVCGEYSCDKLGWVKQESSADKACIGQKNGCTDEFCCEPTCVAKVNNCPANFQKNLDNKKIKCRKETCDHIKTCCDLDPSVEPGDIDCEDCPKMESAVYFDFKLDSVDYDKFILNNGLKRGLNRTIRNAAVLAASPHIGASQVHLAFSKGSLKVRVYIDSQKPAKDDLTYYILHLMTQAITPADGENTFKAEVMKALPDLASVTGGKEPILTNLTLPMVGALTRGRKAKAESRFIKFLPDFMKNIILKVGWVNAFFVLGASCTLLLLCCYANVLSNGQEEEFTVDDDRVHSVSSFASQKSSAVNTGRLASGRSYASSSSSAGGTKAGKVVPPTVRVHICGQSPPYPIRKAEPEEVTKFYGEWSSGIFAVDHDWKQFFVAIFCFPVFLPWRMFETIDRVGEIEGPCCTSINKDTAWFRTLVASISYTAGVLGLAVKVAGLAFKGVGYPTSVFLMLMIPMIFRQLVVHRGVAIRYRIDEGDFSSWSKALFLICCMSMQSGRHIDTYYFDHPRRDNKAPILPILGSPVKILGGSESKPDDSDDGNDQPKGALSATQAAEENK